MLRSASIEAFVMKERKTIVKQSEVARSSDKLGVLSWYIFINFESLAIQMFISSTVVFSLLRKRKIFIA